MTQLLSICPHCRQPGIRMRDKRYSRLGHPAVCAQCQGLSHVLGSTSSGIFSVTLALLVAAAMVGVAMESWLAGLACAALALPVRAWAWQRAELFPTFSSSAKNANRADWAVAITALLAWIGL